MPAQAGKTADIQLLGGLQVVAPDGTAKPIAGRKVQGLLAILALSPGLRATRDRLSGLLWGDRGDDQARNSLRQALVSLRNQLAELGPEIVQADREGIGLVPDRVVIDVAEFEKAARGGDAVRAASLYTGPFLEGVHVRADEFEDWASAERRRLADLAASIQEKVCSTSVGQERVAAARRLVSFDPLRESAHRILMEAFAAVGERDLALRQYEECRDLLDRELHTRPSPETEHLKTEIAAGPAALPASAHRPDIEIRGKPTIAVLPFANLSGDPEQEHFADGVSEDIITALSKVSKLFVIARNSTFTYKGRAVDVRQVGREQGVRYVLDGSVQRRANRMRITAQLSDANSGQHVWAQRYDRAASDFFELQDEITREVISALQVELTDGEQARLWASGTKDLRAWELAIQIPELLDSHRRVDVLPARRLAEQALQIDENYAAAWAMLGWSHWNEAVNDWTDDPERSLSLALDALERARSIDGSNSNTLALLAFLHLSLRKFDLAYELSERSMELGPSNSFAAAVAANVALFCGKPHEMVPLIERAMRLCPVYPAYYVGDLAYAYLMMGRQEESISAAQEAIGIDPDYIYTYHVLAVAYAETGQEKLARAAAREILRIEPKFSVSGYVRSQPFQKPEDLDRMASGLRKAGLPE